MTLIACAPRAGEDVQGTPTSLAATSNSKPASVQTYQSDIALTAAWVTTLTPAYAPPATAQSPSETSSNGTPFLQRNGNCEEQADYNVNYRQGFCLATPRSWSILNVDGGLAAFLQTTPGQSISIQPDWASSSADCHLLVFVTQAISVTAYLQPRYSEMGTRTDLVELTPLEPQLLGDIALTGYTWNDQAGGNGGVFAAMISDTRLVQISYGGSNCPIDQLLPVLETLRFN